MRQENYANLVTALPPQNSPAAAHAEVACTAFAVILMTTRKSTASANHSHIFTGMYSSIAHSCTNNTVVAGYHDSRRNTDTPYRSLWRYICSSCARAGVFHGIPVCPVYRFFLVLPLQAGKSGHRLYDVLSIQRESGNGIKNTQKKRHLQKKKKHVWLSGRLHIEGRLNEGPRLQRKHLDENDAKQCLQLMILSHPNVLTFFPPDWGMLRRSRRVLIFL